MDEAASRCDATPEELEIEKRAAQGTRGGLTAENELTARRAAESAGTESRLVLSMPERGVSVVPLCLGL